MGADDWKFKIYYSVEHDNCLLLSKPDKNDCYSDIDIVYNYEFDNLTVNKIKITDEMEELGVIFPNCYKIKKADLKTDDDFDIDIKV